MGHVREGNGEVLVAGNVQRCASLRVNVDPFGGSTLRRTAPDLTTNHTVQVDGRLGDDGNRSRADAVPSGSKGRSDKPGGRSSIDEQENCGYMQVPNGGCRLLIQVHGEDRGRPGEAGCGRG